MSKSWLLDSFIEGCTTDPIVQSALRGDAEEAIAALAACDLKSYNEKKGNVTLLHAVCLGGSLPLFKWIEARGIKKRLIDTSVLHDTDKSFFLTACLGNSPPLIDYIAQRYPDLLGSVETYGFNAIYFALTGFGPEYVKHRICVSLLDKGVSFVKDEEDPTYLFTALGEQLFTIGALFLSKGCDPSLPNSGGQTALGFACAVFLVQEEEKQRRDNQYVPKSIQDFINQMVPYFSKADNERLFSTLPSDLQKTHHLPSLSIYERIAYFKNQFDAAVDPVEKANIQLDVRGAFYTDYPRIRWLEHHLHNTFSLPQGVFRHHIAPFLDYDAKDGKFR